MTSNLFERSIRIIKASQTHTGAYLASPNFSQYNYCWFRDGTYIAYAMDLVGEHESASRFYDWAVTTIAARAVQVEKAVESASRGVKPAPDEILHTRYTVEGKVSEDDWPNFQLDGFGTLLWGISQHLDFTERSLSGLPGVWSEAIALLVRYLGALWTLPCYDCWEEFEDKIHTYTLAALYGGLRAASRMLPASDTGSVEAAAVAELIKQFVLDKCVSGVSLCKFVGSDAVDGSLVNVATPYMLLAPSDPVMRMTVERIEGELRSEAGGVHRYAEDSYFGGGEWLLLTAYLGWYYAEVGEVDRAQKLLRWVEDCANANDELPEQMPYHLNYPDMLPTWEERWGRVATPLLWSHAAYLTLLTRLGNKK